MKSEKNPLLVFRPGTVGLLLVLCSLASCATGPAREVHDWDLLLTNGRIVDGTGAPWFRGDVAIRGDSIVAVGALDRNRAAEIVDVGDRIVAPGFIDLLGWSHFPALVEPALEGKIRQGVTTEATGEGRSPGPIDDAMAARWRGVGGENPVEFRTLGDFMALIESRGTSLNFAFFVGATNPREIVLGLNDVQPDEEQLRRMEAIVDQAMREGAIGISTSLIYVPARYATTEELIRLARVASSWGGVYFSHMRSEDDGILEAVDETVRISREAAIPANIWHLKVADRNAAGRMTIVLEKIEEARRNGVDIAANLYPYAASSTGLDQLAPNWALEGGYGAFLDRLADPELRSRIIEEIRGPGRYQRIGGAPGVIVSSIGNPEMKHLEPMYLSEIAERLGMDPVDALIHIFENNRSAPQAIYFSMNEQDMKEALRRPWVSVGADSGSVVASRRTSGAHPRAYGTFPRVVGRFVREEGLLTLEDAVRKVTSQAATRIGVHDRGVIRPGMKADVVVFDPARLNDISTFEDPHHYSVGIDHVIVNGVFVLRDAAMTGSLPGRVLRGPGYQR